MMLKKLFWRLHPSRQRTIEVEVVDRAQEGWYWADIYIVHYIGGLSPADVYFKERVNRTALPGDWVSDTQARVPMHRINPGYEP